MFDRLQLAEPLRTPALALARWTALLLGWVWLGAQGQRIGWSLASGLFAVAAWWAMRLLFARWKPWRRCAPGAFLLVSGGLTALGAAWVAQAEIGAVAAWALVAVAALWALWSASLDAQASRCQRPWVGWPPVAAALLAWGAVSPGWAGQGFTVVGVVSAVALLAWSAAPAQSLDPKRSSSGLPQTAMGLMMGSLWLSGAWCASGGWPMDSVVGFHLLCMAVLPGLVRRDFIPRHLPPLAGRVLPLVLVATGGGLVWAGPSLANGLVGMGLLALAWALPSRHESGTAPGRWAKLAFNWAPLGGPVLLLAVGVWSPTVGPLAMAMAYGGLGALAGLTLLGMAVFRWAQGNAQSEPQVSSSHQA